MGSLNRPICIVGICDVITCRDKRLSCLNNPGQLWSPPFLLFSWYQNVRGQDMKLTTHLHLVERLRMCRTYLYYIFVIFGWISGNSFKLLLSYTWEHWLLFGEVNGVTFFNTAVLYEAKEVWFNVSPHSCKSKFTS